MDEQVSSGNSVVGEVAVVYYYYCDHCYYLPYYYDYNAELMDEQVSVVAEM